MVSSLAFTLSFLLCVAVVPLVWADSCISFEDQYGSYHDEEPCSIFQFCCGDCNNRYCCKDRKYRLSQDEQDRCAFRPFVGKAGRTALVLIIVLGVLLPIIFCVGLVVCCVAPCCLFYKKCRKRNRQQTVTTIVHSPGQPMGPSGYQPAYPSQPAYTGYQPVPGFGPPTASAPPSSYMEITNPSHIPVAFSEGDPMYPLQPPQPDDLVHPPYNPSYGNNP